MEQTKLKALELNAAKARLYGVQMVHDAASGHPGGSMSCMDVLTYLYFAEMRVDPGADIGQPHRVQPVEHGR